MKWSQIVISLEYGLDVIGATEALTPEQVARLADVLEEDFKGESQEFLNLLQALKPLMDEDPIIADCVADNGTPRTSQRLSTQLVLLSKVYHEALASGVKP